MDVLVPEDAAGCVHGCNIAEEALFVNLCEDSVRLKIAQAVQEELQKEKKTRFILLPRLRLMLVYDVIFIMSYLPPFKGLFTFRGNAACET